MSASTIFINGEILTMNDNNDVVEAVAIKGNKIIQTGSTKMIMTYGDSDTTIIDLQGKSMTPGIIDAHLHMMLYGIFQLNISCKEPHLNTIDAILQAIQQRANETPKGEWVRAWGFNELAVQDQRYPTREELDAISTEHPIVVTRTCGHIGVVNSAALKKASITVQTEAPQGGIIEKDKNGQLTGRLIENAYMRFNEQATYTAKEMEQALHIAQAHFLAHGITSVHDAGTFNHDSFRIMQHASHNGDIKIRIYAMIGSLNDCYTFTTNMMRAGVVTGTGNEFFKIGPAKLFTDGSSTGPTIATREPYTSDNNNYGILVYSEDEVYEVLGKAHQQGYQITVHAQGDQAIELYLNVVERALREYPRENHRHRVEHAGIATPDLQARMQALQVVPVINPPFPYEFGEGYLKNYGERTNYMYAAKDLLAMNIPCAAGSDAPITDYNPMIGIHTAVNRQVNTNIAFGQQQQVTLQEALKMYTVHAAYASFDEQIKGTIEVGKLADLVVWDARLTNVENNKIKDVKATLTMLDGEILYDQLGGQ